MPGKLWLPYVQCVGVCVTCVQGAILHISMQLHHNVVLRNARLHHVSVLLVTSGMLLGVHYKVVPWYDLTLILYSLQGGAAIRDVHIYITLSELLLLLFLCHYFCLFLCQEVMCRHC